MPFIQNHEETLSKFDSFASSNHCDEAFQEASIIYFENVNKNNNEPIFCSNEFSNKLTIIKLDNVCETNNEEYGFENEIKKELAIELNNQSSGEFERYTKKNQNASLENTFDQLVDENNNHEEEMIASNLIQSSNEIETVALNTAAHTLQATNDNELLQKRCKKVSVNLKRLSPNEIIKIQNELKQIRVAQDLKKKISKGKIKKNASCQQTILENKF